MSPVSDSTRTILAGTFRQSRINPEHAGAALAYAVDVLLEVADPDAENIGSAVADLLDSLEAEGWRRDVAGRFFEEALARVHRRLFGPVPPAPAARHLRAL